MFTTIPEKRIVVDALVEYWHTTIKFTKNNALKKKLNRMIEKSKQDLKESLQGRI